MTLGRPGALLADRYRLDRLVDVAGSAERWQAYDVRLARPVTARLTPATGDSAHEEAAQAALERMARINHPGVAAVYDVGTADGLADGAASYAISEWTDGRTLEQIMATGPQSWSRTADWGRQISGALAALHSVGLAHGALGPNSVAIHDDRRVKILDAGLSAAGAEDEDAAEDGTAEDRETETESAQSDEAIEPAQTSELGEALPAGAADDVYALGFLLWEATVGAAPDFAAEDARELDQQPLREAHVPAQMVALLVEMLDADPAQRPAAAALEQRFEPFAVAERDMLPQVEPVPDKTQVIVPAPAVGPAQPTGPAQRERRRRRGLLTGLALLLAAIGAGVGLLLASLNHSNATSPDIGNTAVPSISPGTVMLPSVSPTPSPSPVQTSAAPATSAAPSRSPSASASPSQSSASPSPSADSSSEAASASASASSTSTAEAGPGPAPDGSASPTAGLG